MVLNQARLGVRDLRTSREVAYDHEPSFYAYVAGNPLNATDPSGRAQVNLPGGYCVWIPFTDHSNCESLGNVAATPPPGSDYGVFSISLFVVSVDWTTTADGSRYFGIGGSASPLPGTSVYYNNVYHANGTRATCSEVDSFAEGPGATFAVGAGYGADVTVSNSTNGEVMIGTGQGATTPNIGITDVWNFKQ